LHISEGILSPALLAGGAVLTICGSAAGLKSIDYDEIPVMGILSAAFFVASLIHLPIGPVSAHLTLNGLLGLILGRRAFPVILVGLTLQALLFQYGGITTIGINTLNIALPAVLCHYIFKKGAGLKTGRIVFNLSVFGCGFFSIFFSAIMVGFSLSLTGRAFLPAAKVAVAAHLPVMFIEGVVTTACILFLKKVRPELLGGK